MKSPDIWKLIHAERIEFANTLDTLSEEQWKTPSWCQGWTVAEVVGHVVSAAEETPLHFYRELVSARFSFDRFAEAGAKRTSAAGSRELIRRLRERTTTTNHPPAPVMAMLGEIVVHGDDVRRPLGLHHATAEAALVAVADNWKKTNILIGSKRRISGLSLRASDASWTNGDGPEVVGPLQSIVLAMTGRKQALADLSGEGVAVLQSRP
jgi:uncharacterized protein (TIGR03083 family)